MQRNCLKKEVVLYKNSFKKEVVIYRNSLIKKPMLRRKITDYLYLWKQDTEHKPLVIKGCRQCGKTYSVLNFAYHNYKNVIYINFIEKPK